MIETPAIRVLRLATLAALSIILCGCGSMPPVPEVDLTGNSLPPAAAQFLTTQQITDDHAGTSSTHIEWRLWRTTNRVTTENLNAQTGEIWQLDGRTLLHQRLYHSDRRSIEVHTDDLEAISKTPPSWPRQSLAIDPQLLSQLTLVGSGWHKRAGNYPYRRYAGDHDGAHWDVIMRTDLMLPVSIVRKRQSMTEHTQLQHAYALPDAPWSPTANEDYEVIDFADLGDRENDPFVVKVEQQLGRPHTH